MGKMYALKWDATLDFTKLAKTRFANKIIMFEETLEFKQTILLYYGRQKSLTL
jgi:hypothetical protein